MMQSDRILIQLNSFNSFNSFHISRFIFMWFFHWFGFKSSSGFNKEFHPTIQLNMRKKEEYDLIKHPVSSEKCWKGSTKRFFLIIVSLIFEWAFEISGLDIGRLIFDMIFFMNKRIYWLNHIKMRAQILM